MPAPFPRRVVADGATAPVGQAPPAAAAAAPAGSGGLPADIDAPAATLHRPGRGAGDEAAEVAATGLAGVEA
jgi:hypothetical protein